ncbi:hypothetical protein [Paracoccus zhejiangensis]|uniref:Secreted protein n=1 Tax=Paracoccus zhejiangensis TaxID=1077935 RepID=A0A2H5F5J1_9RHOB|nr:hypothetical protein [Paracoccus zhejiangensis]AUH66816.1 hypothetical protein CX676_21195 [Paracoccus zhejiangensis]
MTTTTVACRRHLSTFALGAICIVLPASCLAVEICIPPDHPIVPESDDLLVEYAEIIEEEFEIYFKEITTYFDCMDRSRHEAFLLAQRRTGAYQNFLHRLEVARRTSGQ